MKAREAILLDEVRRFVDEKIELVRVDNRASLLEAEQRLNDRSRHLWEERMADYFGRDDRLHIKSWTPGEHGLGALVRHRGGVWQARGMTTDEPTPGSMWLCVADGVQTAGLAKAEDPRSVKIELTLSSGNVHSMEFSLPVLWPTGRWEPEKEYSILDIVTWRGSSWVSNRQNVGEEPGSTPCWNLFVQRGERGRKGDAGADADMEALRVVAEETARAAAAPVVEAQAEFERRQSSILHELCAMIRETRLERIP